MALRALYGCLLSIVVSSSPARAESVPRVVVLDLTAETPMDDGVVRVLNEIMVTELAELEGIEVFGGSDMDALLSMETQRRLVGCSDSECLNEFIGALGSRYVLSATIGVVGERQIINMKVLDTKTAAIVARHTDSCDRSDDVAELVTDATQHLVELLTEKLPALDEQPVVEQSQPPPTVESDNLADAQATPAPSEGSLFITRAPELPAIGAWGASAVALGFGIGFGIAARNHYDYVQNLDYIGRQLAVGATRRSQRNANISYGVAVTAAVTGVVLWWLFDEPEAP